MGRVAAIGESIRVQGLALAGVLVLPGDGPEQVRASWAALPDDVAVVMLTGNAADALGRERPGQPGRPGRQGPLTVVMPE